MQQNYATVHRFVSSCKKYGLVCLHRACVREQVYYVATVTKPETSAVLVKQGLYTGGCTGIWHMGVCLFLYLLSNSRVQHGNYSVKCVCLCLFSGKWDLKGINNLIATLTASQRPIANIRYTKNLHTTNVPGLKDSTVTQHRVGKSHYCTSPVKVVPWFICHLNVGYTKV